MVHTFNPTQHSGGRGKCVICEFEAIWCLRLFVLQNRDSQSYTDKPYLEKNITKQNKIMLLSYNDTLPGTGIKVDRKTNGIKDSYLK